MIPTCTDRTYHFTAAAANVVTVAVVVVVVAALVSVRLSKHTRLEKNVEKTTSPVKHRLRRCDYIVAVVDAVAVDIIVDAVVQTPKGNKSGVKLTSYKFNADLLLRWWCCCFRSMAISSSCKCILTKRPSVKSNCAELLNCHPLEC